DRPVISPERVMLAKWLANYYLSPLFAAVALMLPPGFERRPLTFYEPLAKAEELDRLRVPPRQREVLEWLIERGTVEGREIEKDTKLKGAATALSQLTQRGLVARTYALDRPSVQAKTARYAALSASSLDVERAIETLESSRKAKLASALRLMLDEGPEIPTSELRQRLGLGVPQLQPLVND